MSHGTQSQHSSSGGAAAAEAPGSPALPTSRWLLPAIALAELMLVLDVTVANVALPSIAAEFRLSAGQIPWIITAYIVTLGGFMLVGGRASDVFGRRRVLLAGLTLFTAASLAAAWAPGGTYLIAARVAQGFGAALTSPSALAALSTTYDGDARRRALQVWAAVGGTGAALGVILGGVLTSGPGWRWVFLINVPVGLVVIGAVVRLLPRRPADAAHRSDAGGWRRLDLPGGLTVTAATASLIYAITIAGQGGGATSLAWFAVAAVLYAAFAVIEQRRRDPLINIRILLHPRVATGASIMMASSAVLAGLFFTLSFHLQAGLGWTPLATGLAFLPAAVGTVVGAHVGSKLVPRWGPRGVAPLALGLAAAGCGFGAVFAGTPWMLPAAAVVAAAGLGAGFVTSTTTALADVDADRAGVVSGIVNTFHEFGAALGIAALSGVAAATTGGLGIGLTGLAIAALAAAVLGAAAIPSGRPATGAATFMH